MTPVETADHRRSTGPTPAPGRANILASIEEELCRLKLDNDDFRFERDRYKSSAAQFQSKLIQALSELDELRILREEVPHLRQQVVDIAREFEERRAGDIAARAEGDVRARQALHEEFRHHYNQQLEQERMRLSTRLGDEYANRLRQEIVSLAVEFEAKLAGRTAADERSAVPANLPEPNGHRPLTKFRNLFGKR